MCGLHATRRRKCCRRRGFSAATECLLRSMPLPQAVALVADAAAVIGRVQAPALQPRVWHWQRQPEPTALNRRRPAPGSVLSSCCSIAQS